jgi:hypothetical protein
VRKLLSWRLSLFPLRRLCAPGDKHSGCFINVVRTRPCHELKGALAEHSTHAGTALHGLAAKTGQHSRHEHSISDGRAAPSVNYGGLDQRRGIVLPDSFHAPHNNGVTNFSKRTMTRTPLMQSLFLAHTIQPHPRHSLADPQCPTRSTALTGPASIHAVCMAEMRAPADRARRAPAPLRAAAAAVVVAMVAQVLPQGSFAQLATPSASAVTMVLQPSYGQFVDCPAGYVAVEACSSGGGGEGCRNPTPTGAALIPGKILITRLVAEGKICLGQPLRATSWKVLAT